MKHAKWFMPEKKKLCNNFSTQNSKNKFLEVRNGASQTLENEIENIGRFSCEISCCPRRLINVACVALSHLVESRRLKLKTSSMKRFDVFNLASWLRSTSLSRCVDFEIYFNFQVARSLVASPRNIFFATENWKYKMWSRGAREMEINKMIFSQTTTMTSKCDLRRKLLIRNISFLC